MKSTLKREGPEDTEDIKIKVREEFLALHTNEFKNGFQQFYEGAQNWVISQRDYF